MQVFAAALVRVQNITPCPLHYTLLERFLTIFAYNDMLGAQVESGSNCVVAESEMKKKKHVITLCYM